MISKNNQFNSDLDRIKYDAVRILDQLILRATDSKALIDGLEEMREILDCLLLDSSDYSLARQRIDNAMRFVQSNESGAAKYEIRMLRGGLRQLLGANPLNSKPNRIVLPTLTSTNLDGFNWNRKLGFVPPSAGNPENK